MYKIIKNKDEWNKIVLDQGGHPLQLWDWGEFKTMHGPWVPKRLVIKVNNEFIGGAQALVRNLPKPFKKLFYVPRGPFCDENNREKILIELSKWAKRQGGVVLKIEPDWIDDNFHMKNWRKSKNQILIPKTAILHLQGKTNDELMSELRRQTRYLVRKSSKSNITIRKVDSRSKQGRVDIESIMKVYRETAKRSKFDMHSEEYYRDLAQKMSSNCKIYLAEKDSEPLAFIWTIRSRTTEFWLYGGTTVTGLRVEANYALNWFAITQAKKDNVETYDLNGLLNDGISTFKRGFGQEVYWIGTWDFPLSPLYFTWERFLPITKKVIQKTRKLRKRAGK